MVEELNDEELDQPDTEEDEETAIDEIAEKVLEKVLEILKGFIDDPKVLDIIAPLVPALVNLGVREGEAAASHVLAGLTGGDPYPHWKKLIKAADTAGRIHIMETQRQRAIQDTLELVQRNEQWKAALDLALKILYAIVPMLITAAL